MKLFKAHDRVDQVFEVSLVLKVLDGLIEIVGGGLLLFVTPGSIHRFGVWVTQQELLDGSHNFLGHHLVEASVHLTVGSVLFAAIYLLSHGIVKIGLVIGIWIEQLWAYLGLIAFTVGFIIYQIYRMYYTHSVGLLLLTLFDFAIVYLTTAEYRKKRKAWAKASLPKEK